MKALFYIGMSLGFALIMYILVHFELLLMNKLINTEVSHQLRIRLCVVSFIATFIVSMLIAYLR